MNKQTYSFYKTFDDLQSRIANLKSVKNLKKEFKRDSITRVLKIEGALLICCLKLF